jgi:ParB-like chromosome segregation protein Spo0J
MKRSLSSLITDTNVREFNALEIETKLIKESTSQARTEFNDSKLNELTESIRKNGILQPLIVQELSGNNYELIAGERRLRASKLAGLEKIPCLVKDVSSRDAAVIGLVEKIAGLEVPVFEARTEKKDLLVGMDISLVKQEMEAIESDQIKGEYVSVGSLNEVTTGGNWPPSYDKANREEEENDQ